MKKDANDFCPPHKVIKIVRKTNNDFGGKFARCIGQMFQWVNQIYKPNQNMYYTICLVGKYQKLKSYLQ